MLGSLAEINMDCVVAFAQVRDSKREVLYSPYSQDLRNQIEHQTYKIYMANKCDKICLDSLERNFTLSLMKSYDTAVQLLSDQDLIHIRHLILQKLKFLLDSIDTDLTHKRVSFKLPHILANLALISTKFDLVDNLTELYSKIDCMKLHEITVPVDSIRWLNINEKVTALASYVKDHGLFDMQHVNVVIFRLRYQDTTFTEYFVLNFFTDKRWLQPLLEIIPPTQTNDFLLIEKTRPYNSSQMVGWLNKIFAGRDSTLEMEQPVERRTWTIRT